MLIAFAVAAAVVLMVELRRSHPDAASFSSAVEAATLQAAPPDTRPVEPITLTVAVTGEILPHPSVVEHARRFGGSSGHAFDFAPLFSDLSPVLGAADLAICHLEVPVAPPGSSLSGYPSFGIPAEIGAGIASTGWDRCSTASNHVNDKGTAGIRATLDALDGAQVGFSGTARTPEEAAAPPIADVAGVPVAHHSYTWGFNGTPPAEPWMSDVIDPDRILADARQARAFGAELVIVSLHWGDEYDTSGSADQRALAEQLLASPDVDLIVGHGPHVLQPIETFHGKYALLSVGNLVANQGRKRPYTYDGVIAEITFTTGADGRLTAGPPVAYPTWYDRDAGRVRLVSAALDDPSAIGVHSGLTDSLTRTAGVLGAHVAAG
jgi:poly-gamma-glutamate synthesis protein (capsule biosynthesis protein)